MIDQRFKFESMPESRFDRDKEAARLECIVNVIQSEGLKHVVEVGGGANPLFSLEQCSSLGIETYTLNDISEIELNKAPSGYEKLCMDFASTENTIKNQYDLAFSFMVCEHVKDAEIFHQNLFQALKPGGVSLHVFPTLYTLPFILNRVIPESVSSTLLNILHPRANRYQNEKFPAYYDWCRGPTPKQIRRFENIGFEILSYKGFFGHVYYRQRLKPLHALELIKTKWLLKYPIYCLTSYAEVMLRKP